MGEGGKRRGLREGGGHLREAAKWYGKYHELAPDDLPSVTKETGRGGDKVKSSCLLVGGCGGGGGGTSGRRSTPAPLHRRGEFWIQGKPELKG